MRTKDLEKVRLEKLKKVEAAQFAHPGLGKKHYPTHSSDFYEVFLC